MDTKFKDNTEPMSQPIYKEMTAEEMQKGTDEMDETYKGIINGINDTLKEGDK